jgi:hypothetical protein
MCFCLLLTTFKHITKLTGSVVYFQSTCKRVGGGCLQIFLLCGIKFLLLFKFNVTWHRAQYLRSITALKIHIIIWERRIHVTGACHSYQCSGDCRTATLHCSSPGLNCNNRWTTHHEDICDSPHAEVMLTMWHTERHEIRCKFLCSLITPRCKVLPEKPTDDQGIIGF